MLSGSPLLHSFSSYYENHELTFSLVMGPSTKYAIIVNIVNNSKESKITHKRKVCP